MDYQCDRLHCVVTGASSGIGRAVALALAQRQHALCLVGRDKDRLEAAAGEARKNSNLVRPFQADLTDDGAMQNLCQYVARELGGVDLLVHAAGAFSAKSIEATPTAEYDNLYRTNVRVPYALTLGLLSAIKSCQGLIVFVNSSQGIYGREASSAFGSTQQALRVIADQLRQEVNSYGVRIISMFLGRTATPRIKALFALEGRTYQPELLLQPEDIGDLIVNILATPRRAEITNLEIRPAVKSY